RPAEDILTHDEVFDYLKKRKGVLQAVTISGGEPTLQKDLKQFAQQAKDLGYLVKLDTNGTNPDLLIDLVESGLVDYVAMDIKNSKQKYAQTAGLSSLDISGVEKSVDFLLGGKIPFEFRTTVVRDFHTAEDFKHIAEWIGNPPGYFLQQFVNSGDLVDDSVHGYDNNEMQQLIKKVQEYIPNAKLRGV
ncbi:MAG: anaerobic ribonucleoside-triphosphate reductase activating protein, partial [Clostridia bacterium]|nr:anaerobic ribonucleoside-triphosphate reductase activating protein [Clostridia bacterium]